MGDFLDAAITAHNNYEKTKTTQQITQEQAASQEIINLSKEKGQAFTTRLRGWDNDSRDVDRAVKILDEVTKDNSEYDIIAFLDGFYDKQGHEGIIELMDDEWCNDDLLTMERKKAFLEKLLKRAEACGLEKTEAYTDIKEILDLEIYQQGTKENTFNNGNEYKRGIKGTIGGAAVGLIALGIANCWHPGGWVLLGCFAVGAIAGAIIGADIDRTDNEIIDDAIEDLHQKIKEKEAGQTG